MSEQTANLCTTDAAESLRAVVAERDREIERLNSDYNEACEDAMCVARELERQKMNCLNLLQQLEDLKAQHEQDAQTIKVLQAMARQLKTEPSGVVRWPEADEIMQMAFEEGQPSEDASGYYFELEEFDLFIQRLMEEVARLNSSPVSDGDPEKCSYQDDPRSPAELSLAGCNCVRFGEGNPHWPCKLHTPVSAGVVDERAAFEQALRTLPDSTGAIAVAIECFDPGQERYYKEEACSGLDLNSFFVVWKLARSAVSASHGEQVREGWQLVPVEPTDAMLEAGDKYIGTPATYKSMLSACPSPTITKDFSQFLSAVMDAAGLIRHGRQSKELSEYLGMKCMEYRGAERAAPSHGDQVRHMVPSWMASARTFVDRLHLAGWRDHADAQHAGAAGMYDELIASLNQPVSAGDDRETIRAVFLRNGFTIKEGQADLKPYVYAAADELMSIARAALSANHSEQVREVCRHEFSDDGEFTVHCSKCDLTINAEPPRHVLDSAAQQAFEAGGTEDGSYVLTGDDLDQIVAQACAMAVIEFAAAPSAGSQKERE